MFYLCLAHGALIREKDRIPFEWCFRTQPGGGTSSERWVPVHFSLEKRIRSKLRSLQEALTDALIGFLYFRLSQIAKWRFDAEKRHSLRPKFRRKVKASSARSAATRTGAGRASLPRKGSKFLEKPQWAISLRRLSLIAAHRFSSDYLSCF